MKIIRFIDVVETLQDEEGNIIETVKMSNFTLPMIIEPHRVESVCALFTAEGKLYKNVSVIKYDSEMMKVLGNPEYIWDLKNNIREPFKGFYGKQRQETVEERTEVKSKSKCRTKGGS